MCTQYTLPTVIDGYMTLLYMHVVAAINRGFGQPPITTLTRKEVGSSSSFIPPHHPQFHRTQGTIKKSSVAPLNIFLPFYNHLVLVAMGFFDFQDGGAALVEKLNSTYSSVNSRAVGSQLVIMTAISVRFYPTQLTDRHSPSLHSHSFGPARKRSMHPRQVPARAN